MKTGIYEIYGLVACFSFLKFSVKKSSLSVKEREKKKITISSIDHSVKDNHPSNTYIHTHDLPFSQ